MFHDTNTLVVKKVSSRNNSKELYTKEFVIACNLFVFFQKIKTNKNIKKKEKSKKYNYSKQTNSSKIQKFKQKIL